MSKLAGGKDKLQQAAKDALADGDNQWSAQLAYHLLAINREDTEAKRIKADALTGLAHDMVNATAGNYYSPSPENLASSETDENEDVFQNSLRALVATCERCL